MKKRWLFLLIGGLAGSSCYAQSLSPSILNAAGGTAVVATLTHEWSVGEMVSVHTATAGSVTLTQGLLQPRYAATAGINEQTSGLQQHVVLYPNPSNGVITLQPDLDAGSNLRLRLLNMAGQELSYREVYLTSGNEAQIFDLGNYASGIYLLQAVWTKGEQHKHAVYKIEKQ